MGRREGEGREEGKDGGEGWREGGERRGRMEGKGAGCSCHKLLGRKGHRDVLREGGGGDCLLRKRVTCL